MEKSERGSNIIFPIILLIAVGKNIKLEKGEHPWPGPYASKKKGLRQRTPQIDSVSHWLFCHVEFEFEKIQISEISLDNFLTF